MMRTLALASLGLAAALAGCGDSGDNGGNGDNPGDLVGETRVEVNVTDRFQIRPTPMTVAAGVPVTFVVTNHGSLPHQFYLGDAAAQDARDAEMLGIDGPGEDSEMGIVIPPGETKELTVTLEAGTILAGCHIPQHYARGMKATVQVVN